MREFEFIIPNEYAGKDIKFILKNHYHFSSNLITSLKVGDGILLNGKKEFVNKIVTNGDLLKLTLIDRTSQNIISEKIPIDILYEDEDLVAVNKPYNMPTHPSIYHRSGTLANAIMYYFKEDDFTFRAPSRLDRDTSGVLIVAKNAFSADGISKQIQDGEFKKEYVALTVGIPKIKTGTINAPIKREAEGIIKRIIAQDGKLAVTDYEVIEEKNNFALIRLHPKTGRTHQIRLHLSYIGTPIYADFLYGEDIKNERIRLHCKSVEFLHPITNKKIKITAPLPNDMNLETIKAASK